MPMEDWTIIAGDYNEDLILLWQSLMDGWIPPNNVSEELYKEMKNSPDNYKDPLKTFVLIGCSFGAKWKGGMARNNTGQNYAEAAKKSLEIKMQSLYGRNNLDFLHCSYDDFMGVENAIIYCDPPYRNTCGYSGTKQKFNSEKFDEIIIDLSKDNLVLISEYLMPMGFETLFEKQKSNSLQSQKGKVDIMTERVFIHPNSLNYLERQISKTA